MGLDMSLLRTKNKTWDDFEEVGYWRKANQIHNWFVQNVQDGNDDCEEYVVSEDKIKELLTVCKTIVDNVTLKTIGTEEVTVVRENGFVKEKQDLQIISDTKLAEELLPTIDGFFFGSTAYNADYYKDLLNTIDILKGTLETTDFKTQTIFYSSSW